MIHLDIQIFVLPKFSTDPNYSKNSLSRRVSENIFFFSPNVYNSRIYSQLSKLLLDQ